MYMLWNRHWKEGSHKMEIFSESQGDRHPRYMSPPSVWKLPRELIICLHQQARYFTVYWTLPSHQATKSSGGRNSLFHQTGDPRIRNHCPIRLKTPMSTVLSPRHSHSSLPGLWINIASLYHSLPPGTPKCVLNLCQDLRGGWCWSERWHNLCPQEHPLAFPFMWTLICTKQGGDQGKGTEVTTYGALSW